MEIASKETVIECENEIVDREVSRIMDRAAKVLSEKGKIYGDDGRFGNFKKAAGLLNLTPEQTLLGFNAKHLAALCDFCRCPSNIADDEWDEKICDTIVYMLLLRAMVKVRKLTDELGIQG